MELSTLPALPDPHGIAVLLLVVVALLLFTRDAIPLESSSLVVLVVLTAGFELFPYAPLASRCMPSIFSRASAMRRWWPSAP